MQLTLLFDTLAMMLAVKLTREKEGKEWGDFRSSLGRLASGTPEEPTFQYVMIYHTQIVGRLLTLTRPPCTLCL